MATGNANFPTALLSSTIDNFIKDNFTDNIFNDIPLFYALNKAKAFREEDGGNKIVVPLMYGKNTSVTMVSDYDVIPIVPQTGITAAEYEWRMAGVQIVISLMEVRKNSGKHRMVNLIEAKMKQAMLSIKDKISEMLYLDGTGDGGKAWLGLAAIVSDTPTTGTVGNIDRSVSANSWWRNQYTTGAKTSTAFDTLQAKMRSMYIKCSNGTDYPDVIVCDTDTFAGFEGTLVGQQRYTSDQETANAGFDNLKFKGSIVFWDKGCPSTSTHGRMYFLNTKYLSLVTDSQVNFMSKEFVDLPDQPAKAKMILHMGNLVCANCNRQGILYDIDLT